MINPALLIADIVYPCSCVSCMMPVGSREYHLCAGCRERLKVAGRSCPVCGGLLKNGGCGLCSTRKFYPERNIAVYEYDDVIRKLLHGLKFHGLRNIYRNFIPLMAETAADIYSDSNAVTYVPMSGRKEAERGYNQSGLIAGGMAGMLSIPCVNFLAERRGFKTQRELGRTDRYINVIDRYRPVNIKILKHKTIILVDDVFTTGATINECARQLLAAGAGKVYSMAVARADPENIDNI